jgi:hypothetical protein
MTSDVFRQVRERVSAQEAARAYGVRLDRRGWGLCPFHGDKHPSMSFKNGRWRCWVCNLSGDSIDLTGRLLGLEPLEAVRRLNQDFHLALELDRPPTPQEHRAAQRSLQVARSHRAFEQWREEFLHRLNACFRAAHLLRFHDFSQLSAGETLALQWQSALEYWSDTLERGSPQEQMEIFRQRKEIFVLTEKILSPTATSAGSR